MPCSNVLDVGCFQKVTFKVYRVVPTRLVDFNDSYWDRVQFAIKRSRETHEPRKISNGIDMPAMSLGVRLQGGQKRRART